jgi:hypothetical protein
MKRIILTALITCLAVGTATAQSCAHCFAVANGKPLHGAAKMSPGIRSDFAGRRNRRAQAKVPLRSVGI